MAKVYVFLADGFEDVEALIPIDVLRRGGVEVVTVSTTEFPLVESAHGVNIEADIQFEQSDYTDADLIMLPGGMPGASNLFEHEGVCKAVMNQFAIGKKVAAICAAPAVVLAQLGVLDGKKATCYPGFEKVLKEAGATYTGDLVTVDGTITTGEGPAAAFPYAYELLTQLVDKKTSDQIAEGMRFKHLMSWFCAMRAILTSLLFVLCIVHTNAQQRTYSIGQLKKHTWTEIWESFEEKSIETVRFTDKEMITERTRTWLKTNDSYTHTYRDPYYLANGKANRFNYSLPGKVKRGSYIINGHHDKKLANLFVSMEIIQLDDQELTLYWCTPEGTIGGCDTVTYRSEVWKPRPPKRETPVPFYLKRPDK